MSETKVVQFPLPLPREVGGHVWLIELPGQPITIADRQMAFDLVNRYNAGPKVRELVEIALELDKHRTDKLYEMAAISLDRMVILARSIQAELGGKAE